MPEWFAETRPVLEQALAVTDAVKALVPVIFKMFREQPRMVSDLGALNRWPERRALPFEQYLGRWLQSCAEVGTRGRLPRKLAHILRVEIAS